jgi:hypothetical protein
MTVPQARNSARRARCHSTSHDGARPALCRPSQIVGQLMQFGAIRRSFVSRFTVAQLVASARSKSASAPAALKSP